MLSAGINLVSAIDIVGLFEPAALQLWI